MKYSGIGGQAVIEGIMMQNGDDYAIAVRKPDGEIEVKRDRYVRRNTPSWAFLLSAAFSNLQTLWWWGCVL